MTLTARTRLGRAGESHARSYLERAGFTFIAANWRCRAGEIDLAMRDGDVVVFVEVKLRHGERAGRAEESVTPHQGKRIMGAAAWFIDEHRELANLVWRIDLVAITLKANGAVERITHWPNAIITG